MWRSLLFLFLFLFGLNFVLCLEYVDNDTLCWQVTANSANNTNTVIDCPLGLGLVWNKKFPKDIDLSKDYTAGYTAMTLENLNGLKMICSHANIHACVSTTFCSPLLTQDNVALQTLNKAQKAVPMLNGTCTFESTLQHENFTSLNPGNYTLIAHVIVSVTMNDGTVVKYSMAIGEYYTLTRFDTKPNILPWLIPVVVLPVIALIVLIIVIIYRRHINANKEVGFAGLIPDYLKPFFDITRIRSKYQVDSPKVYKFKVVKKTIEYDLLQELIHKLEFKDILIQDAYAVYSEQLVQNFFIQRSILQARLASDAGNSDFCKDTWKQKPNAEQRAKIIIHFGNKIRQWPWNEGTEDIKQVPILAVAHGTDLDIAWKITRGGFVALQKLDSGYYGRGIYVTSSAWYTAQYFSIAATPAILLCLVMPGNPYPVTESPKIAHSLNGKEIIPGYQSHYVLTAIHGLPITEHHRDSTYDELVVQSEAQIIPIFVVEVDKVNISDIVLKMKREVEAYKQLSLTDEDSDEPIERQSLLGSTNQHPIPIGRNISTGDD